MNRCRNVSLGALLVLGLASVRVSAAPGDETATEADGAATEAGGVCADLPPAESVARDTGCLRCHAVFDTVVGPAYFDVARRYRDDPGARARLIGIVQNGGKGQWTEITRGVPMPPHSSRLTEPLVAHLVDWVLGLDDEPDETTMRPKGAQR